MIEVKDLTKIYKSRKGGACTALDGISFTLPDRGFVFIVGKSGSGKTTLLSLLGGLDTPTSGEIIEGGRALSAMSHADQVYYRNARVGFIFQDFHLLEELTISENVSLALALRGEEDGERVQRALANTDLKELADRYPKELSGGQKQRVAIARALVKQPAILLADEPTGNLDSKTTVQILSLLKELSKEKLVVIVSHNLSDAEAYADEILELSEGRILRHVRRNEAFNPNLRVEGDTLIIPGGEQFTESNLEEVSRAMKIGRITAVRQETDRFAPLHPRGACPKEEPQIERRHLKFRSTLALAAKFGKRGALRGIVYAVILALLLTVLGLSQLFMHFDGGEVIASEMEKRNLRCNSFLKGESAAYDSLDATRLVDVEEGDLQAFYDAGYEGKAYPLINFSLSAHDDDIAVRQMKFKQSVNPYALSGLGGVLITEQSFLERQFGPLKFVATAEEQKDHGIYITDFFADACIVNRAQINTREDMLGPYSKFTDHKYGYVNGILDTGYRERYKDLLEKVTDPNTTKEELKSLAESEEYLKFHDEVCEYLAVGYTFEPDFVEKLLSSKARQFTSVGISTFEVGGKAFEWRDSFYSCSDKHNTIPLQDNEVLMSYETYNSIFHTNYTSATLDKFEPHEVKFSYYASCDQNRSQKKFEATLNIIGLRDQKVLCNLADNVFYALQGIGMCTLGYYFEGGDAHLLFNVANENGFVPNSSMASSITAMTKVVGVFRDFFYLIFGALCAMLFLLIVQYEVKNIKDRMREIGILKALGARDRDFLVIFGLQAAAVGLLMAVLYVFGAFGFVQAANGLLAFSLAELSKSAVTDLHFLHVNWLFWMQNCFIALLLFALSFLVPMLWLRHIKPTNVIKAKE